ncbi:MAG: PaaX family transcriptional regulator C-terminal domain-containing protein [Chloroflexota bacterium]
MDSSPHRVTNNTKFLIITLLGDYIMPHGGSIWLSDFLYLLELLGVGERTARSTITRMAQQGWFSIEKEGRRSRYTITPQGITILERGDLRVFEVPLMDWDEQWFLVVYSLPEDKRKLRNDLRKQLTWLGFGRLAPGTWISPHHRKNALDRLFAELEVTSYVNTFSGLHHGPLPNADLVRHCWDIPDLTHRYQTFVTHYQPEYEACQQTVTTADLSAEISFTHRFWMTHTFLPFLREDPNLPAQLLPDDWIGFQARTLFDSYRQLLAPSVNVFIEAVVERE